MSGIIQKLTLVIGILFCSSSWAHEGHDHDLPKVVSAPRGGMIQAFKLGYVEVVVSGNGLKIYVYGLDVKPIPTSKVAVAAKAILPRSKGATELTVTPTVDFFESKFDAKNLHRYTLLISVKPTGEQHPIELKYTIEPRG